MLRDVAEDVFGIVGTLQAGQFRVEQVVAEGGFAVVYRAHHTAFRAAVALKCLKVPATLTGEHQTQFLDRFREEAELLFRLSAGIPTVVRPLHVGTLQTNERAFVPFLALEWLDGKTLEESIAEKRARGLPPANLTELVRLLTPIAKALERAHHFPDAAGELAILHRDLKPENIFVARVHGGEAVKLLDFGIGKVKHAATQIVGKLSAREDALSSFTPCYGAPEQWLPKRFGQTGPWTDVWGLALTLVEACSGITPFPGDHGAILSAVVDETVRPTPRTLGVSVPDTVEAVFKRALAVDPRDRYPSMEAFWSALASALGTATTERMPAEKIATLESGRNPVLPDLLIETKAASPRAPAPRSGGGPLRIGLQRDGEAKHRPAELAFGGKMLDDEDDFELGTRAAHLPTPARRVPLELDGVGLSALPPSRRVYSVASTVAADRSPRSEVSSIRAKLRQPIKAIVLGCVLMVADYAYTALNDEPFALGPVRAFWIAAPLVIAGIGLAVVRLFTRED